MTIRGCAFSLLLAVAACSSSSGDPGFSGGGTDQGPASPGARGGGGSDTAAGNGGGANAATNNGGGGSTGGSSAGGGGGNVRVDASTGPARQPTYSDAAAQSLWDVSAPDAAGTQVYTFKMDTFVVNPGDEVYKCQQIGNPFGKDVDFIYYEGQMSAGSHHLFLFNMDPSTMRTQAAPFGDCPGKGIEFHPFPYGSMQPNFNVGYPEQGMGYHFVTSHGLMLNSHYLNSGSTPITAQVQVKVTVAAPGTVSKYVGTLFLNNTLFSVPANVPMTSPIAETASTVPLNTDYQILTSICHMHKTSLGFTVSANGQVFYSESNWDEPKLFVHTPYLAMKGGTKITWTCNYYNPTSQTLSFGDSAVTNVMCIYMGQYFPADPNNSDVISVLN